MKIKVDRTTRRTRSSRAPTASPPSRSARPRPSPSCRTAIPPSSAASTPARRRTTSRGAVPGQDPGPRLLLQDARRAGRHTELLIFITPRILNRQAGACRRRREPAMKRKHLLIALALALLRLRCRQPLQHRDHSVAPRPSTPRPASSRPAGEVILGTAAPTTSRSPAVPQLRARALRPEQPRRPELRSPRATTPSKDWSVDVGESPREPDRLHGAVQALARPGRHLRREHLSRRVLGHDRARRG